MMTQRNKRNIGYLLVVPILAWLCFWPPVETHAGWETGARIGFDTNIDRALEDEKSDAYLSPYLTFFRNPSGESRVDWTLSATLEGSLFARLNDLNSVSLAVAPGVTWIPHRLWIINISPFFQAKGVSDSDQSALAYGAKISMRQQFGKDMYAGQYYIYKDSRAEEDVYSFVENALGVYIGKSWTLKFYTELGYEYSHGDSFRSFSTSAPVPSTSPGSGSGKQRRYSSAFDKEVIKEKVDRHSVGLGAGIDWSKSLSSTIAYNYTTMKGDSGSSSSHSGSINLGYRF